MTAQDGPAAGPSATSTSATAKSNSRETPGQTTDGVRIATVTNAIGGIQTTQTQVVYTNSRETDFVDVAQVTADVGGRRTVSVGHAVVEVISTQGGQLSIAKLPFVESSASSDSALPPTVSTTASSAPTSSPSPGNSSGGNGGGIKSGTAAGIGVGAAVGGILLASLVFCLWFRRSTQRRPHYDSEIPLKRSPSYGENKAPGLSQVTAVGIWNSSAEKHLPQPPADDSISSEMSKLRSLINNHVQSYYRTSDVDLDAIDQTAVAALIESPQISTSALASSIADPKTRIPALRYLIASAVFSRIGLRSHPTTTFLPPEVSACLGSMTGLQEDEPARASLLSRWRTISATMLQPTYGSKTIAEDDPRAHNIGQALDELDAVLVRLRARRDENSQRRRNLEEILKRAAGFAFLLFSHPSFWEFGWQATHTYEPGSVVIFPALLQVTDEGGQRHGRPRTLEEMEVAPLLVS